MSTELHRPTQKQKSTELQQPAQKGQSTELHTNRKILPSNIRAKFAKPKRPEVGKWKNNEAKAQHNKNKPTFDMLMSKYSNQEVGSISNRSSRLKHPRSPPKQRSQRHARPYESWVPAPWMVPHFCVPYYSGDFNKEWGQPPMAPYAFYLGWAAPRRFVHDRSS